MTAIWYLQRLPLIMSYPVLQADMMRAMLLRAMVYERSGKEGRGNELMNAIIQRRF
jgi:hypothetical protein